MHPHSLKDTIYYSKTVNAGEVGVAPNKATQLSLKAPDGSKDADQSVSSKALMTICISLAKGFQARAGEEGVAPGMGNQSLLKSPEELKDATHRESS